MKIVSINVSMGKTVVWRGREVETGIYKEPVEGPVLVRRLGIEGDRQSDLEVHGGADKAVYAYSLDHYDWWRGQLPDADLAPGAFGENLTVEGLDEDEVAVGDVFEAGGALLEAVQPRFPCYKLGVKFDDMGMVKLFSNSGRWGVYFRVLREGPLRRGDAMERVSRPAETFFVPDLIRLSESGWRTEDIRRALQVGALCPDWREMLEEKLKKGQADGEP